MAGVQMKILLVAKFTMLFKKFCVKPEKALKSSMCQAIMMRRCGVTLGTHFGGIQVRPRDIYKGVNGKKYLVLHGDKFDNVMLCARWLAYIGDYAYGFCPDTQTILGGIRRAMGLKYWSLSAFLKIKVKMRFNLLANMSAIINEAKRAKTDGVICGHIHHAEMKNI